MGLDVRITLAKLEFCLINYLISFGFPKELLFRGNDSEMGPKELPS